MDKPKVILIYDDEVAECIARNIEVQRPYLCLPYESARKLMEELDGLKFDLFLTDIAAERDSVVSYGSIYDLNEHQLSKVSGADLGFKVKRLFPQTPILTLSGYNDKPVFSNYHLVKPVTSKELLRTLDDFLRE